ncbi:uncharacterized protein LOC143265819 [Megachile rotundata]|uniref:uncharacterized protein LOC143265819 n=1 Tax=Megachile rotundata TaxID=143995 RepID=UPI003FD4F937
MEKKEEKESSKSRKEARKAPNVPEDSSASKVVGHFDAAVKENQRVVESWSEGCVGESKCDGKIRPQGIDAVLSAASFCSKRKRLICTGSDFASDPNVKIGHMPRFFPIKDDLNSTEILLCEELLKRENNRRSRFNLQEEDRSRNQSQREENVDYENFGETSWVDNFFRKNNRLYRSNYTSEEAMDEAERGHRESRGRRRKDRKGRGRWRAPDSFCPTSDMLARSEYCSQVRSSETINTGVSNRKTGGGEDSLKSTNHRSESIAKFRTNARPQFPNPISTKEKEKRSRRIIKADVSPEGFAFESNSRDLQFDAMDYAHLEKPLFRHRNYEESRKNSSTTCCCPESKFSRCRYRCRPEFSKIDRVKLAKPNGRINLSKVLVYPPCGEEGPPLTLYKNVSSIRCAVRGNADVGFRYDVTYVQKFSSAYFPGYQLL